MKNKKTSGNSTVLRLRAELKTAKADLQEAYETNAHLRKLLATPSHSYTQQFERAEEAVAKVRALRKTLRELRGCFSDKQPSEEAEGILRLVDEALALVL